MRIRDSVFRLRNVYLVVDQSIKITISIWNNKSVAPKLGLEGQLSLLEWEVLREKKHYILYTISTIDVSVWDPC